MLRKEAMKDLNFYFPNLFFSSYVGKMFPRYAPLIIPLHLFLLVHFHLEKSLRSENNASPRNCLTHYLIKMYKENSFSLSLII